MMRIQLFLLCLVSMGLWGCVDSDENPPVSQKPRETLTDEEYQNLLSFGLDGLVRKALAGELGNCEIQNLRNKVGGCYGADTFVLVIRDRSLYYPAMTTEMNESLHCRGNIESLTKQALQEGFCYTNSIDAAELSGGSLMRKALANDLGYCTVQNVRNKQNGCYGGDTFVLFLKNKSLYYPEMTYEMSESLHCSDRVAQSTKEALKEGFCFPK